MTPDEYIETALKDLSDVYGPATVLAHATVLFAPPEPSSPSRTTDPATSHASGTRHSTRDVRRFSRDSLQGKLLAWYQYVGLDGLTALEAAHRLGSHSAHRIESARKRVSELARAGYIHDSGTTRRNPGSDDAAVVWRITEAGTIAGTKMVQTGWTR